MVGGGVRALRVLRVLRGFTLSVVGLCLPRTLSVLPGLLGGVLLPGGSGCSFVRRIAEEAVVYVSRVRAGVSVPV